MEGLMGKFGGAEVLRKAVSGMLPKNRLRDDRMHRLKAFEGSAHPYKENLVRVGGRVVGGALSWRGQEGRMNDERL